MSQELVAWILISIQVLGILVHIGQIGKPREPYSPLSAVIALIITVPVVWGLAYIGGIV